MNNPEALSLLEAIIKTATEQLAGWKTSEAERIAAAEACTAISDGGWIAYCDGGLGLVAKPCAGFNRGCTLHPTPVQPGVNGTVLGASASSRDIAERRAAVYHAGPHLAGYKAVKVADVAGLRIAELSSDIATWKEMARELQGKIDAEIEQLQIDRQGAFLASKGILQ